jgi:hypothetical protein
LIASSLIIVNYVEAIKVEGKTLYVGGSGLGNFTRIQDAIDNTSDGDVIFVYSGDYFENIVIDKSISLVGEDAESTVIIGLFERNVVRVTSDNVYISNLSIIQNYNEHYDIYLIYFENSDNSIIENTFLNGQINQSKNFFNVTNSNGIMVSKSNNFKILNNNLINNKNAIDVYSSNNVLINDNLILDNINLGIHATSYINHPHSNDIVINDNIIISNEYGIHFFGDKVSINNNYINNSFLGMYLGSCSYDSFLKNNYISNCTGGLFSTGKLNVINNTFINNNLEINPTKAAIKALSGTRIYYNNFLNNGRAILISDNNGIEVKCNNILNNIIGINFEYHRRIEDDKNQPMNIIDSNYWGKTYSSPIVIFGIIGIFRIPKLVPSGEDFWNWVIIPWFNFDWNPAKEPYDIPMSDVP